MIMSTPSQRMQASSLTKECETFFFDSFAFVQWDRAPTISRSGRHSISHNVRGSTRDRRSIHNEAAATHPARSAIKATDTDLEPASSHQDLEFCQLTPPIERNRIAIDGSDRISDKSKERGLIFQHKTTPQANKPLVPHQVSFSQDNVNTIKGRVTSCAFNSTRKDSYTTYRKGSNSTCNSSTKPANGSKSGPSISALVNWPPPPPPRLSPHKPNSKTRNLSLYFESRHEIELPFSNATKSSSSRPCHPTRLYNILEQDQTNQQRQQQKCNATKSPTAVSSPRRFSPTQRSDNGYLDTLSGKKYVHHKKTEETHRGFRQDYILGETARSPSHMIIESCPQKAAKNVAQLKNHDFAFVKRTDGSWTYSILASRSFIGGLEVNETPEECMLFVMSDGGSTKLIKRRQWGDFIRLVAVQDDFAVGVGNATVQDLVTEFQSHLIFDDGWVPEHISIEFGGDDSSSISFVSS